MGVPGSERQVGEIGASSDAGDCEERVDPSESVEGGISSI